MSPDRLRRITVEKGKYGGRPCITPCIRKFRIRVTDVLTLLDAGSFEDILAAIEYAAQQTDHAVLQPRNG